MPRLFRELGPEKVALPSSLERGLLGSLGVLAALGDLARSRPLLAAAQEIRPSRGSQNPTALDRHYETVRVGMAGILRELGVAA
jgi:hypothetical protein